MARTITKEEVDQILSGHDWIKVRKYDDPYLTGGPADGNWENQYHKLSNHHDRETEFLIAKVRDLAQKLFKAEHELALVNFGESDY